MPGADRTGRAQNWATCFPLTSNQKRSGVQPKKKTTYPIHCKLTAIQFTPLRNFNEMMGRNIIFFGFESLQKAVSFAFNNSHCSILRLCCLSPPLWICVFIYIKSVSVSFLLYLTASWDQMYSKASTQKQAVSPSKRHDRLPCFLLAQISA